MKNKAAATREGTLLTIAPKGELDRSALVAILDQHYRGLAVPHLLWDLRGANVSGLTLVDFEILSKVANRLRIDQDNRRTAYMFRDVADEVRFSSYLAQGAAAKLPGQHAVFRDVDQAHAWLGEPRQKA